MLLLSKDKLLTPKKKNSFKAGSSLSNNSGNKRLAIVVNKCLVGAQLKNKCKNDSSSGLSTFAIEQKVQVLGVLSLK
jgi:hypothetical protein